MSPYLSLTDYAERFLRLGVAYILLAMLFVLSVVSVPYPISAFFKTPLLLMALYYWCVYRPTLLPPWLVFAAGVLFDLVSGVQFIGLHGLLFLLYRVAILDQRRFVVGQSFPMVWLGFLIVATVYHASLWIAFSVLNLQLMPIKASLPVYALSIFVFPIVYICLHLTHKILPEQITTKTLRSQKPNIPL